METILRPRKANEVPPGGWRWVDPEMPSISMGGHHLRSLETRVKQYLIVNGRPIGGNWENDFYANICKNTRDNQCDDIDPNRVDMGASLSLFDVARGTAAIAVVMVSRGLQAIGIGSGPFVENEEAERRSSICALCPLNVSYNIPCRACQDLKRAVDAVKGGRSTSKDGLLKACQICSCSNEAQVHVKLPILRGLSTNRMDELWPTIERGYSFNCWKRKEV